MKSEIHQNKKDWPKNVNAKHSTVSLHWVQTEIIYQQTACLWAKNFCRFLSESCQSLAEEPRAVLTDRCSTAQSPTVDRIINSFVEILGFEGGVLNAIEDSVNEIRSRGNAQANLLFSVTSQQDNIKNQSISVSAFVFTFISALFLPCTLVASVFSLSVFDWQPDPDPDSGSSYASDKLWIFWAFSIPLTLMVMGCWYMWIRYGMERWQQQPDHRTKPKAKHAEGQPSNETEADDGESQSSYGPEARFRDRRRRVRAAKRSTVPKASVLTALDPTRILRRKGRNVHDDIP